MNSFNATTPNFDNLILQSLMNRLQIRPPLNPPPPQSLEDLLFNTLPFSSEAEDEYEYEYNDNQIIDSLSTLSKEESRVEKEIIRKILTGKTDSLKPNSGQAVVIGEHHICIGFHEDTGSGSDYRVWEWHGHIMLFDEENGYTPEYIYGNYFERVNGKVMMKKDEEETEKDEEEESEKDEKIGNLGLRELIESGETSNEGRILRRNVNAGSSRVYSSAVLRQRNNLRLLHVLLKYCIAKQKQELVADENSSFFSLIHYLIREVENLLQNKLFFFRKQMYLMLSYAENAPTSFAALANCPPPPPPPSVCVIFISRMVVSKGVLSFEVDSSFDQFSNSFFYLLPEHRIFFWM